MTKNRKPDFNNVIKVLRRQVPSRPTLGELYLNGALFEDVLGEKHTDSYIENNKLHVRAWRALGYDYVSLFAPLEIHFPNIDVKSKFTLSFDHSANVIDDESLENYAWPDAANHDYSYLSEENLELIDGMKAIVMGPAGVLENTILVLGYDNLCIMLYENPGLVKKVTDKVGSVLLEYYKNCVAYDTVAGCYVNDDWGFNTQTSLPPKAMREYIIPWHKKIVEAIHKESKYAWMHSCGNLREVMDDIIYDIKMDAKHSFEDAIMPVEQAYTELRDKIAIIGGVDMDYQCRSTSEDVYNRASNLLQLTKSKGGYLLGSGNSIPEYVPRENYFAMISAGLNGW